MSTARLRRVVRAANALLLSSCAQSCHELTSCSTLTEFDTSTPCKSATGLLSKPLTTPAATAGRLLASRRTKKGSRACWKALFLATPSTTSRNALLWFSCSSDTCDTPSPIRELLRKGTRSSRTCAAFSPSLPLPPLSDPIRQGGRIGELAAHNQSVDNSLEDLLLHQLLQNRRLSLSQKFPPCRLGARLQEDQPVPVNQLDASWTWEQVFVADVEGVKVLRREDPPPELLPAHAQPHDSSSVSRGRQADLPRDLPA
eukprot:747891-Hanusia_phi.AAC.1